MSWYNKFTTVPTLSMTKRLHALLFTLLVVVNMFLHAAYIGKPSRPVFDEHHFATYAADYASGHAFFDIHPPLGKIIYAVSLSLFAQRDTYENIKFLERNYEKDRVATTFIPTENATDYGSFPYILLRVISSLFGIALAIATYAFIRVVTNSPTAALWGMFFVTLENTLLLHSRLILMDAMFLTFALLGITLLLSRRVHPLLAGIVFGLALSVKLTAIAFIGVIILSAIRALGDSRKRLIKSFAPYVQFMIAGIITLFLFSFAVNPFLAPIEDRVNQYTQILESNVQFDKEAFFGESRHPILQTKTGQHFIMSVIEVASGVVGYSSGMTSQTAHSPWYEWPLRMHTFIYFQEQNAEAQKETVIALEGNQVTGRLGLAAIIVSILFLIFPKMLDEKDRHVFLFLLGGYLYALLPFSFVTRATFFYHYFPALIFEISLLSYLIVCAQRSSPHRARIAAVLLVSATIIGFILVAPFTYGIPVPLG